MGGYHGANNIKEIDGTHDALINLATAASEDREIMMSQSKIIADLTQTFAALTWHLQQETTGYNRGPRMPVNRRSQSNSKWVNRKHLQDVGGYCWTHGHCVDIGHDSKKCRRKRERDIRRTLQDPTTWEETRPHALGLPYGFPPMLLAPKCR